MLKYSNKLGNCLKGIPKEKINKTKEDNKEILKVVLSKYLFLNNLTFLFAK